MKVSLSAEKVVDLEKAYKTAFSKSPWISRDSYLGILPKHEAFWVDIQPMLFQRGYQLRPRYRPGWIPSWLKSTKTITEIYDYEDAFSLRVLSLPSLFSVTGQRLTTV